MCIELVALAVDPKPAKHIFRSSHFLLLYTIYFYHANTNVNSYYLYSLFAVEDLHSIIYLVMKIFEAGKHANALEFKSIEMFWRITQIRFGGTML